MMERKQGIEYWIDVVTAEQKRLKLDVSTKWETISEASKALKEIQQKKPN
jgi:hypothetical protein